MAKKTKKENEETKSAAKADVDVLKSAPKAAFNAAENSAESSSAMRDEQSVPQNNPAADAQAHKMDEESSWVLQADRAAMGEPLIEALRLMAGFYGRRTSAAGLTAGLPIPPTGITPALFIRAAERADLQARLTERTLESLAIAPNLPCILSLEKGQACVLWDIKFPENHAPALDENKRLIVHEDTRFIVQFSETREEKQEMGLQDLARLYTGYAFFVRPVARADERAGPAEIENGRDWFWSNFRKNKTIYGEVALAAVMINLFGVASSLFTMNVYDRVVPNVFSNDSSAIYTLWALVAGISIVYLFDFTLRNMRAHFLDFAGRRADVRISASLFEQILGMTMAARPPSAGVLASNMKEFETLRDFFTSATMVTLIDLPFALVYIGFIALIGGPVAFVPLAAVPLVIGMGFLLQKSLRKIIRQSLHESALKNALLFETLIGLETVKVQAAEGHRQRSWEELSDKASRTAVKSRRIASFAQNWALFIQQNVTVWIVVVGVHLIAEKEITMGALVGCVILSGRAMAPLAQVAGLLTRLNQSRESLHHLDELMKKPVERPYGKHLISMPHVHGRLEFRDVVFRYPGQNMPALNKVNFTINPGEKVGVIGAVGSGKTTIERLLLNLYEPESGSVQIDGTDVRQVNPGDLRRNVGAVQQSPQLFFGSVRDNITMGHETAPDRAVLKAAELSGVMEFLRDSQAGLDTQVGERGEALSGGQRQAVAIARALLYDPPILVLDEPTASMDPASENRLKRRLHTLCQNKTTLLITHKGAMLALVDKLILLDRGKIIAYGPRDEVISKLQARQYGTAAEDTDV